MNSKITKKIRKLAKDQTNQSPQFFKDTYKKMKEIFLKGSKPSKKTLKSAIKEIE